MRGGSKRYFKVHPWKIIEDKFCLESNEISESVFSLGNEYMGTRGLFEEGISTNSVENCFIGGIYAKEAQSYGWKRKGFANYSNAMVNTTNWLRITIEVGGEKFNMQRSNFREYSRELDMKNGLLRRQLIFVTRHGEQTQLSWERLISRSDRHIGAIRLSLKALNHQSPVKLGFILDSVHENRTCFNNVTHCRMTEGKADTEQIYLLINVATSGQYYIHRMAVGYPDNVEFEKKYVEKDRYVACNVRFTPKRGVTYNFDKVVSVWTSRDAGYPYGMIPKESDVTVISKDREKEVVEYLITKSRDCLKSWLDKARPQQRVSVTTDAPGALLEESYVSEHFSSGSKRHNSDNQELSENEGGGLYELIKTEHIRKIAEFWDTVDIEIEGAEEAQQGIRYCMFQLSNAYSGHDEYLNVGPKGYTGEHYWGRAFWDSESYCIPFYLFTNPDAARKLIEYRYNTLDAARDRAALFGYNGAMYPITTIDGTEDLNYWEYSFCEIHVNSIVPYVVYLYDHIVGDKEFLYSKGIEILIEVARFWASRGKFIPYRNGFGINRVIGPDEWQQFVNNNFYTNYMAKWVFEYAAQVLEEMKRQSPNKLDAVVEKLGFDFAEMDKWKKAADKMILNYDPEMDVFVQDDMFLSLDPMCREELDWDRDIPIESKWTIDRYLKTQLLKQPDVLLLMFLFRERFTQKQKLRNYRFYEQRTAHGSSLSPCIHSIIASDIGVHHQAYDYYLWASRLDLENSNNNTHEGLHISSMAGSWLNVVCGFGGMKYGGVVPEFAPILPEKWHRYSFKLNYAGSIIRISVSRGNLHYRLISGKSVKAKIYDQEVIFEGEEKEMVMPENCYVFRKAEAVIFDLDGVIVDTARYHYQAWKAIADEEGIYFDEVINERLKGVSRMGSLQIIMEKSQRHYTQQQLQKLAAKKNSLYVRMLDSLGPEDILPGISELIDSLKDKGLKIALCSASKNVNKILDKLKIRDFFDVVITGSDICKSKPDPEGFNLAAQKLGVDNKSCVVVEDAFAGIEAAKNAGMKSVGIGDKCKLYNADYVLSSTSLLSLSTILHLY